MLITDAAAYLSVMEPDSLRWTCQGSPSCWTRTGCTGCTVSSALSRSAAARAAVLAGRGEDLGEIVAEQLEPA